MRRRKQLRECRYSDKSTQANSLEGGKKKNFATYFGNILKTRIAGVQSNGNTSGQQLQAMKNGNKYLDKKVLRNLDQLELLFDLKLKGQERYDYSRISDLTLLGTLALLCTLFNLSGTMHLVPLLSSSA